MLNQSQFAKQRGWSRQYVGKLVSQGVITLDENGLIDPERAEEELEANRGGTMREAPIKSRRGDGRVRLEWGAPDSTWIPQMDVILEHLHYRCGACGFLSRLDGVTLAESSSILRDVLEKGLAELDKLDAEEG